MISQLYFYPVQLCRKEYARGQGFWCVLYDDLVSNIQFNVDCMFSYLAIYPAAGRLPAEEGMDRLKSLRRQLSMKYDNTTEKYLELPDSTHTLLHTEPIASIPFLFSLAIAVLSATCLLLVLVNEWSDGQDGNFLDVPTGVSTGVRGAQYCGK